MDNRYRVAIVGAGGMGSTHFYSYFAIPEVNVVAIVDRDLEKAGELASEVGAKAVRSLEEAVNLGVDIVDVCTPTPFHAELAIEAMQLGKHVIVEKPIARTVAEAEEMADVARKTGVTFMTAHCQRFDHDCGTAYETVHSGRIGPLKSAWLSKVGPHPDVENSPWYMDEAQSGGLSLDLAIHDFDYIQWLFGSRVKTVSAMGVKHRLPLVTYFLAQLRFADGKIATIESSWAHPHDFPFQWSGELVGTEGFLTFNSHEGSAVRLLQEGRGESRHAPFAHDCYVAELRHFVHCVKTGQDPSVTPEEAISALKVGLAVNDSLQTGKAVDVEGMGS